MLWAIVHRTFMLIHSWLESHLVSRWCCWLPSKRGSHRECVCALLQLQRKWLCVKNERKQQQPPIYDAVQGHFTFPSRLPVTPKNQTHGKKASIENRHHSLEVSSGIYTYIYIYIYAYELERRLVSMIMPRVCFSHITSKKRGIKISDGVAFIAEERASARQGLKWHDTTSGNWNEELGFATTSLQVLDQRHLCRYRAAKNESK